MSVLHEKVAFTLLMPNVGNADTVSLSIAPVKPAVLPEFYASAKTVSVHAVSLCACICHCTESGRRIFLLQSRLVLVSVLSYVVALLK